MEVSLYRRPVLRVPPEGGCGSPPGRSGKARGRFGRDDPRCPWAASRPPRGVRTRWGSGTPGQNGDGPCCTTPQHNAHVTGIPDDREVFYAWHPWAGKTVRVHKVTRHPTGAVARCTAVEGDSAERAQELPVWMLDAAWCRPMHRADEPVPSLDALRALQALLGEVTGGAEATERNPIRSAIHIKGSNARAVHQHDKGLQALPDGARPERLGGTGRSCHGSGRIRTSSRCPPVNRPKATPYGRFRNLSKAHAHPPLGGLGNVLAAAEVTDQAKALGLVFDAVVCASGRPPTSSRTGPERAAARQWRARRVHG